MIALLAIGLGAAVQASEQLSIEDSIEHNRAIESIIWSIPLVSSKMMRDGLQRDAGVGLNDVAYFSKLQTWKIDFTTNNNTTPYIHFFWNAEKEPVVVEIPPSTADVGLVGTLLDFWQRSMIGVGAAGFDGGRDAVVPIESQECA